MSRQCWKCKAELKSKRQVFCPKCGIVMPFDGQRIAKRLQARQERIDQQLDGLYLDTRSSCILCIKGIAIATVACASIIVSCPMIVIVPLLMIGALLHAAWADRFQMALWLGGPLLLAYVCRRPLVEQIQNWDASHKENLRGNLKARAKRTRRQLDQHRANMETIHPDFKPESVLLRPAVASSTNTLVRPIEGNAAAEPELLLRADDDDKQG